MYDATAISAVVFDPFDPLTDTRQRCIDIVSSGWSRAIFAKTEEECEAIYMETREKANKAPIRETLAAGIMSLVPWKPGRILVDPMCGSGTCYRSCHDGYKYGTWS